eukprot:12232484-Heterocapsa_arctica.AAC.1
MKTKKAVPELTMGQGGSNINQNLLFRNTNAFIDEERDITYWYARPKGYLKDQAEARGWRPAANLYTQRSGEK